jgi:DNA-binding winged helix-turn-helix (wHTH) protein
LQARFATFTFDAATRELRCGDQPIHLSPKAFDLLGLLLRQRPNAVSKTDLHRELWPDSFVSDGSLAVLVAEVRRAIGDSANRPLFVRTINRFGYAFAGAAADVVANDAPPGRAGGACSLTWGGERARLKQGENVLGRDLDADVYIDAIGVSRRHAVIVVDDDGVTLRDLSSKNGTFVNGARVIAAVALLDDSEVRLGAVCLRFRRPSQAAPTQTLG